ncbi:hypothetical protein PCL_07280 [Purpureocillium lilacinum]|uniref:Uncharacterized protein n=1 Tax=Purpureocillium lilacinum TaxID=33203 RepID=A0A2U3DSJ3_PURLI|nr:hypothetical protein PCL_07280 [Purpureocillium lilacinum]
MEQALPDDMARSFEMTETPSTISSVHTPPTCFNDENLASEASGAFDTTIGGCLASELPMHLQHPLDVSTAQTFQPYPLYMEPTMPAPNFCELLGLNVAENATKNLELA